MQRVSLRLVQSLAMLDHQRAKGECVSLLARFLPGQTDSVFKTESV